MHDRPRLTITAEETAYWRSTPHGFVPAFWGPQYCLLCSDPKRRVIHLDRKAMTHGDPRRYAGYESTTGNWMETWWKVEAWNDDGRSCSYGRPGLESREQAEEYARSLAEHGDTRGERYDHYAAVEYRHYSVCTTLVHPITPAKESE